MFLEVFSNNIEVICLIPPSSLLTSFLLPSGSPSQFFPFPSSQLLCVTNLYPNVSISTSSFFNKAAAILIRPQIPSVLFLHWLPIWDLNSSETELGHGTTGVWIRKITWMIQFSLYLPWIGIELEADSQLANFHSTRRCYASCWGRGAGVGKIINHITLSSFESGEL